LKLAGTPIIDAQNRAADLGVLRDQFRDNPGIARKFIQGLFEIPHKAWATGELPSPPDAMLYSLNAMSGAFPFAGAGQLGVAGGKPFYSALKGAVEGSPLTKAPGEQWAGTIRNTPGIKQEELDWTGFNEFLKSKPSVTKQEASDFLDANKVDVQEVVKGGDNSHLTTTQALAANEPKFSQYQLPGGENYRELLLTLPEKPLAELPSGLKVEPDPMGPGYMVRLPKGGGEARGYSWGRTPEAAEADAIKMLNENRGQEGFKSPHYDEPNILAHVRFNDRVDASGKKTLFLEEIQSDWHQKGRKEGYRNANQPQQQAAYNKYVAEGMPAFEAMERAQSEFGSGPIPDAPFKTSWPDLSLKRMIKYAVDNGYDSVSWTPGKVQAKRYSLSTQIKEIKADRLGDKYDLMVYSHDGKTIPVSSRTADQLPDLIGKEMAEKVIADLKHNHSSKKYRGLDLEVGGEGMNAFYDKMLPAAANKLGKKYGAKVGVTRIAGSKVEPNPNAGVGENLRRGNSPELTHEVWSLPITDAMRKEVGEKGVPLFSGGAPVLQPSDEERAKTLQSLMGNQS
jgi:hypothetical protein